MWGLEEGYYCKTFGLWLCLPFLGKLSQIRESLYHKMFRSCRLRKFIQLTIYSNFFRKIQAKKLSQIHIWYIDGTEKQDYSVGTLLKVSLI